MGVDEPHRARRASQTVRFTRRFGGVPLSQVKRVVPERPLALTVAPARDGALTATLENPYARPLDKVWLACAEAPGSTLTLLRELGPATAYPVRVSLPPNAREVFLMDEGRAALAAPVPRFVPLSLDGATAVADGDPKVRAAVSATPGPDGVRLEYDFDPGWRFAELRLPDGKAEGMPVELGLWVEGNGSGDLLRMRYVDATGQTFQPDGGALDWTGWRYVAFPLDGMGGHWGGANDGVVHFPIRIGTLALVDMPGGRGGKGAIVVARPTLAYPR